MNQFLDYTTARDLWKGIDTLLCSERDELQIFDQSTKAITLVQGKDSIEVYFGKLNTIWKEIDRRMPNPMKCVEDITNSILLFKGRGCINFWLELRLHRQRKT